MRKVFFDTETSSLKPGQIGQLSMIIEDDDFSITAKNYFFKIEELDEGAAKACNRTIDFYTEASNGKLFSDYADEIVDIMNGSLLIAHNIKFDMKFINAELKRLGKVVKPAELFDTMEHFKPIVNLYNSYGRLKSPKLEELVNHLNIYKDKVKAYSNKLFGDANNNEITYHDSRFDTTAMFVAFQVHKENVNNNIGYGWTTTFCTEGVN